VLDVLKKLGMELGELKGERQFARCPFHAPDKNPSWFVRLRGERRGQHYCFACKSGGTLIGLVEQVLKTGPEAAREFLNRCAYEEEPIPEVPALTVRVEVISMTKKLRVPPEAIFEPFERWVSPAKRYAEQRGLTAKQVERWGIGYAVHGPLQGRIIIPVYDAMGKFSNYMARDFTGVAKARYMYPAGAEEPDLDALFGEAHWDHGQRVELFVTEGALNALAIERALPWIPPAHVAALGGSTVRPAHIARFGLFKRVAIVTDPDHAGDMAALQLDAALARTMSVRRVRLREGTDAASVPEEELRAALA
jgi:DNA primase